MVFYFSGTGNSLYAAKSIAEQNNEELISISATLNGNQECYEYILKENEIVGFVYPIYAWGPPEIVLEFIDKLKLSNYKNNYSFSVVTCGANIGNTIKVMKTILNKKGINLSSGFSIVMPNNYILMGNVDSKQVEKEKLLKADETLKDINIAIKEKVMDVFKVEKGFVPWLLTGVVNPMFNKNAINTTKFYANDNCTSCGICEKVCNCNNIKVDEKVHWGNHCTQCLACIHFCPVKEIQYGKGTEKKGRYTNPNISIADMSKDL